MERKSNNRPDLTYEIKERIEDRRKEQKLRQIDIAENSEGVISYDNYKNIVRRDRKSKIEKGNVSISERQLEALSKVLDCTVDYILCKSNDPYKISFCRLIYAPFCILFGADLDCVA